MPDFYYIEYSSPCRAIALLADYLNIELNKKFVNLATKEHLKPEFAKINPHKTVPCLVDDDLVLNESRAQMAYLVNKYRPDNLLYPIDPKERALVDNGLYFDATSLYSTFISNIYAILKEDADINDNLLKKTDYYLDLFNEDLKKSKFTAGDHMTIADISLLTTIKSIECTGFWGDFLAKYSQINDWIKNLKSNWSDESWNNLLELPNTQYGFFIRQKLEANRAAKKN